ncbi:MAG: PQQ-binding-like beta-propeller repeat protein [Clostridia bacterium]|nr:PQQ-binding-like beta-propeller repeat protein [Clostridia bacterium]
MDLFKDNQQADEQATRAVEPLTGAVPAAEKPARRRRTERFAGLIEETENPFDDPDFFGADQQVPQPAEPAAFQENPFEASVRLPDNEDLLLPDTLAQMAVPPKAEEHELSPGFTQQVPPAETARVRVPSQGVPRPAALSGQPPHRAQQPQTQSTPAVRRPVNAEGYAPLQQLGTQEPRARRPETEAPRRVRTPEADNRSSRRIAYEDVPVEEERSSRGLIAVIIALLVLAAIIVGLLMIPDDAEGLLGDIKRAVTEPVKALLNGDQEDEKPAPATASDFTAAISQATAPYKIVFHMVTSSHVTAVRIVDEAGEPIPTVTTLSAPNSESTIVWMFDLTLENDFEGRVQAQMQNGESWVDTGLWQSISVGVGNPTGSVTPATVTGEPAQAASATPAATDAPTQAPTATPAPVTQAPTETPAPTPESVQVALEVLGAPTPLVTATPTLSVTATPTLMPTATPVPETAETPLPEETEAAPTTEPTAAPTEEAVQEPSPTPEVTPPLTASAAPGAEPSLITETEIYKDGKKAKEYERAKPLNMPASDAYLTQPFGVTTFRGNAFRQNAAVGRVDGAGSLSLAWTVEAGSVAGSSRNYYGIGWTGQPVIAKWPTDVRKNMDLAQERKDQKNMKEVIVAGLDGNIYFLDLLDGSATREAIEFGYPMRATPSLHPLSYPMMTFGQYARKMKSGTSDNIGLYYYNLMNLKRLRLIDGLDRKLKRPYSENAAGAFDTSALIDRTTGTLVAIGTNGLLYTEKLTMSLRVADRETGEIVYDFAEPAETVTMMSHTKGQKSTNVAVESSLAMYANYAYYADLDGVLRCVDTTTMTTVWAVDTGDSVRAAIALDLEENETSRLWLYTANLVNSGRTKGDVSIRRFDAMTGEEDWAFAIHCAKGKKKDVTFNNIIIPGAMASPVIGQHGLDELVYFTLSSVSATGAQKLGSDEAVPGVIIALDKENGEVVWSKTMEAYCYASPVAVYDEAGKGWIIQACSSGVLYLLDGLTGETVSTLAVNGVIEGSPAVYDDMLVIGTTGKNTSYIYGVKIN